MTEAGWMSARRWHRIWRGAAACALHLPLLIAYSVTVVVLFVLSVALMPLFLLGLPLLAVTFSVVRAFAAAERGRCRLLLELPVDAPPRPPAPGWRKQLREDVRAARTWRQLAYFAVLPFAGLLAFLLPLSMTGAGIAALLVPFVDLPASPVVHLGQQRLPGWAWLPVGLVLLALATWLIRACAYAWGLLVRALLGRGVEDELSERIEKLTGSRDALAAAAEAERTRIERDLHDGAQQRLVALAMNLGLARAKLQTDPGAIGGYVIAAHEEAKAALAELRDLARGIHPVVLADRGLDAALSAVAARCPIPVEVDVAPALNPPRPIEAVAYFVVTEALTNIAKHSGADSASVGVRRDGDSLVVRITDNGRGGADPANGSGLIGLARRVEGAEGTFGLTSPPGGPTIITAELPCAS